LPTQKSWDVQIVRGNVLADFADVIRLGVCKYKPRTPLLDLMDDVRQSLLHRLIWYFAAGLPSLRQERLLLADAFLVGVLEAGGDHGDLHRVLHVVILPRADNSVGSCVGGF